MRVKCTPNGVTTLRCVNRDAVNLPRFRKMLTDGEEGDDLVELPCHERREGRRIADVLQERRFNTKPARQGSQHVLALLGYARHRPLEVHGQRGPLARYF